MALATNSTPGSIVIAGDLTGTSSDIQLKPSGVTAGEYTNPTVVIDQKGRVIYAVDNPPPTDAATETELGLVKVGDNLSIDPDGTLNVDLPDATTSSKGIIQAGSGTTVIDGVLYVEGAQDATTTNKGIVQIGSGLSVTDGVVSLNAQPDATTSTKGLVQIGSGLSVSNGIVSATIPDATISSKGLVRIGSGLSVTGGVVSTNIPDATTSTKGVVQVGSGLDVTDGTISIPNASTTTKGIVQVGAGLSVTDGTISVAYPDASTATKGLARIGAGLSVTGGVVSLTTTPPNASTTVKGLIQKGTGFDDAAYADGELGISLATETTLGRVRLGGTGIGSATGFLSAVDATVSIKGVVQVGTNLLVASGVVSVDPAWSSAVDPVRASPATSNLYTAAQGSGFGYAVTSGSAGVISVSLPTQVGEVRWYILTDNIRVRSPGTYGVGATTDLSTDTDGATLTPVASVHVENSAFMVYDDYRFQAYSGLDSSVTHSYYGSNAIAGGLCNGGVVKIYLQTPFQDAICARLDDGPVIYPTGLPYSSSMESLSGRIIYFKGYYYVDLRPASVSPVKIYRSANLRTWVEHYDTGVDYIEVNVGASSDHLVYFARASATAADVYTISSHLDPVDVDVGSSWVGLVPISRKTPIVVGADASFVAVCLNTSRMQVIRRSTGGTLTQIDYVGNNLVGYADFDGAIVSGLPANVLSATGVAAAYASTSDFTTWSPMSVIRRDSTTDFIWRHEGEPVFFKKTSSVYYVPTPSAGWRATNIPRVPNTPNTAVSGRFCLVKHTRTSATGGIVTYF